MNAPIRNLRQVSQAAADVDRAVAFYRDVVGLRLIAQFGNLAFFDLDGVRLLLEQSDDVTAGSILYLGVGDIRAARHELERRGVTFEDEPHAVFTDAAGSFGPAGEEEWMTFFRDPDGNLLALSARQVAAAGAGAGG